MSSNIENVNYDNFKNICRFCMFNCDIKITQDCLISDVSYKLTDIQFDASDELPQQICQKCFDKINEIHEFSFQCKRTHSSLTECLNKYKKSRLNDEQDEAENTNIPKRGELLIILERIDFADGENLNSTNVNDELKLSPITLENTNNELNDDIIQETSEFNSDQNINCSDDSLLILNTSNIKAEIEEESNVAHLNDLTEETSSSNSDTSIIKTAEINNKESNNISFKTHKSMRSSGLDYKCKQCSKSFTQSLTLRRHMRVHSGKRPFKCDRCSKCFMRFDHLKRHMRVHSGERPFKCDQCSKCFNQSCNLKQHMGIHRGERPFKCEQCSKCFTQSSSLKVHIRIHSGELPFKCNLCSKSFNQSNHLKRHLRIHSGERPFKCDQCSRSFSRLCILQRHMRTHSDEPSFKHCILKSN